MKSNSTISPNKLIESNEKIYIVDIDSIEEITAYEQVSYTYEIYELKITNRPNLKEYIESNYKKLLEFAINADVEKLLMPNDSEIKEAEKEIMIINLLSDLGVI